MEQTDEQQLPSQELHSFFFHGPSYSVTQNISIASHWFLKQLLKSVPLRRYKITVYPVTVGSVPS